MSGGLFNIVFSDYTGCHSDIHFMDDAGWLSDSAVIPHIYMQKGRWHIALTFAWINNPFRFIRRYITDNYESEKKATIYAAYYCRSSQKDKRGILTISNNDFTVNYN